MVDVDNIDLETIFTAAFPKLSRVKPFDMKRAARRLELRALKKAKKLLPCKSIL